MKKIYFSLLAAVAAFGLNAQIETNIITNHFEDAVSDPSPANWNIGTYTWNGGNGYVSGNNAFGDLAVLQLFDADYGVTGEGTINNVKILISRKTVSGTNAGSVEIGVWENNNGSPGNALGTVSVTMAALDTAAASLATIGTLGDANDPLRGLYNNEVSFATPIDIPANGSFFAGILLSPNTADGDTAVVTSTTMPGYVFADASTHAGTLASDGTTFDAFGASSVNVALAIFPEVTLDFTSAVEYGKITSKVYPNPASETVNIEVAEVDLVEEVVFFNAMGQKVGSQVINASNTQVSVADFAQGFYTYQLVDSKGEVLKMDRLSIVK